MPKEVWIVGGSNGAGNTTWVLEALETFKGRLHLSAGQVAADGHAGSHKVREWSLPLESEVLDSQEVNLASFVAGK
jgi:ABC-type molybdenum transport system ATPase subunit/photorepair protein PhrA